MFYNNVDSVEEKPIGQNILGYEWWQKNYLVVKSSCRSESMASYHPPPGKMEKFFHTPRPGKFLKF
jgi:hypothetical protein